MLTKAIIQSIDYTKNMCRVRIPLFENASRNVNMIEADAQINIVPGIYNSYKTGDIVFIGFEENKMELPVILGKLFVSATAEAGSYRGNVSGNSLAITDTAQLPYTTIFNYGQITQNNALYANLNTPKKLADGIINLQRSQVQKYQTVIKVNINDTEYRLYLKTSSDFTYTPGNSDESIYKLAAALQNSCPNGEVVPLDAAIIKTVEQVTDGDIEKENIIYTPFQALIQVQELISTDLKLDVFIGGSKYEINKTDILSIQSSAIYY